MPSDRMLELGLPDRAEATRQAADGPPAEEDAPRRPVPRFAAFRHATLGWGVRAHANAPLVGYVRNLVDVPFEVRQRELARPVNRARDGRPTPRNPWQLSLTLGRLGPPAFEGRFRTRRDAAVELLRRAEEERAQRAHPG